MSKAGETAASVPATGGTGMDAVLSDLAGSLESLADETCARIYADLEAYSQIEPTALASAVDRNLRTALTALRQRVVPPPESLDGAAQTARERYESGVPVEEIVRGFRVSIALIHERFVDLAVVGRLPVEEIVSGSHILWGVGDAFTTRIITAYHAIELDAALRNAQYRASAVRALLAGEPLDGTALSALDLHASYAAVRCEVPATMDAEKVRRLLETSGSANSSGAMVVADGGTCLGVVSARPADPGLPVGLGPFVGPDDLPRSDRIARLALRLAQRLRRRGVQSVEELGWRLAAVSRPDAWRLYADRFLSPLAAEGPFGDEVLAAVRAWLELGQSIPRAAARLTVHVNTVRYRLRRFEELTGAELGDPDDVVGIWWALELGDPSSFELS